ncbi:glycosyltransferase involved in cell wall biosynthesis [Pedobacter sp. CAN_A7]|uniref:glycosyltransferase family 2 protein n=1 Tax=Pedobacter sp. CAN_A7 TaxID=2787722 RepID=UPI0018CB457A
MKVKDFFKVSVIIPVYNAEHYLLQCVESVLKFDEVGEVILIEDGSPDNSIQICRELEKANEKVKFFQHPNGRNFGAGASRNLGIQNARFDFVAFLDADDYYLPNRFEQERVLFQDPNIDGVYGATGFFVEGEGLIAGKLTTFKERVDPEFLLRKLVKLEGRFTTDAITIRKSLFSKTGLFNVSLLLHQDTDLWYRLAFFGVLVPGTIESAVAIRRVHSLNRIKNMSTKTRAVFHSAVFENFRNYDNVDAASMKIIINRHILAVSKNPFDRVVNYLKLFSQYPKYLKSFVKF